MSDKDDEKQEQEDCTHCLGSGMDFPDCEECDGNGWVYDPSDGGTMTCPECYNEPCSECQ